MAPESAKNAAPESAKDAATAGFLPMGYAHRSRFMKIPSVKSYLPQFPPAAAVMVCLLCLICAGCPQQNGGSAGLAAHLLRKVDLTSPSQPRFSDDAVDLATARNEWTDFAVQIDTPNAASLRLSGFNQIAVSAYQVVPVPVDLNNAEYVRHSGNDGQTRPVPRALLLLPMSGSAVNLPNSHTAGPIQVWFDLHVSSDAPPGNFQATCELLDSANRTIATMPVKVTVDSFVLPDAPHLQMVGQIDWPTLVRLYPTEFDGIMPRLLNRTDPRYAPAVRVLDQLITMAHENHVELVVPRLQPTVKWSPGEIDWSDYDPLVAPWLSGSAFDDHTPLGYWPMPAPDFVDNYDPQSRTQFWHEAAAHFEKSGWLARCPAVLHSDSPGAVTAADALILSAEARQVLAAHPGLLVRLPLQDDQLQLASSANPNVTDPSNTARLFTLAPPLVSAAPAQPWPDNAARPQHWLNGDCGGDENDLRTWAALAFVRNASLISWLNPLPSTNAIDQPSPSDQLIWFYPGQWFGVDRPVETIQLKSLRRAQQDFEYLYLAHKTGSTIAQQVAELIAKPVELPAGSEDDATFSLLCGMSESHAWVEARQLLADHIAGRLTDKSPLDLRTPRWLAQQQRPTVLTRGVKWTWDNSPDAGGHRLNVAVDVDLYNPPGSPTEGNQLAWSGLQSGWEIRPQPIEVEKLPAGSVQRVTAEARYDLNETTPESAKPLELTLVGGGVGQTVASQFAAPVAASQRLRNDPIIDGSLDDWSAADAIQLDRPLIRMLNRPAIARQELQSAELPTSIYSGWSNDDFFLAFRLGDVDPMNVKTARNFVDYQSRRAWSEDLAEILIQPIYIDSSTGPTLHIICKPAGNWTERKTADQWQAFEGAGILYASSVDPQQRIWRGELAIPWSSITNSDHGRPSLLRFNFVQHQNSTGRSASWAGPVDYGRDDELMGLIHLRDTVMPDMANVHP